jgi:hypothetical protein
VLFLLLLATLLVVLPPAFVADDASVDPLPKTTRLAPGEGRAGTKPLINEQEGNRVFCSRVRQLQIIRHLSILCILN